MRVTIRPLYFWWCYCWSRWCRGEAYITELKNIAAITFDIVHGVVLRLDFSTHNHNRLKVSQLLKRGVREIKLTGNVSSSVVRCHRAVLSKQATLNSGSFLVFGWARLFVVVGSLLSDLLLKFFSHYIRTRRLVKLEILKYKTILTF